MSKIKNQVQNLNAIVNDVLANGINSLYVDNLSGITDITNILNGYANINTRVMCETSANGNNLIHIQLLDDGYGYCSVILDETLSNKEWYSLIRGLHFHCDIHYNYPELEPYIGRFNPLSANKNLELTANGQDTLKLIIRMATDQHTASVKNRYNIF